jgi:GH35 family endo-1,4-beta-xylanase
MLSPIFQPPDVIKAVLTSNFSIHLSAGWTMKLLSVSTFILYLSVHGTGATPLHPRGASNGVLANASLYALAVATGKTYFGSATDNLDAESAGDVPYQKILASEFGSITPGNCMKWDHTEPSQGSFDFAAGDSQVSIAEANGQTIRGHNLVWYSQYPLS